MVFLVEYGFVAVDMQLYGSVLTTMQSPLA